MKPFDIDEARAGKPVCLEDGTPVKVLTCDRNSICYPVIALVGEDEDVYCYSSEGQYICDSNEKDSLDLYMAPLVRTGWVNIYVFEDGFTEVSDTMWNSKKEAVNHVVSNTTAVAVCQSEVTYEI